METHEKLADVDVDDEHFERYMSAQIQKKKQLDEGQAEAVDTGSKTGMKHATSYKQFKIIRCLFRHCNSSNHT